MNVTMWAPMGHIWLETLMVLAIDALLIAVVAGTVFVFTWPMERSARRRARRFADTVARGDVAAAQAAAEQAMTTTSGPIPATSPPHPDVQGA